MHPMTIDGPIESFAPFHNVNCPKGFLYFNRQVSLVPRVRTRKVPLVGTPALLRSLELTQNLVEQGAPNLATFRLVGFNFIMAG